MDQRIYYMPKISGTYSDTLAAFGLAVILREIYERANGIGSGKRILLRDCGPYYQVELPQALQPEWVERCEFFWPGRARAIHTAKKPVPEEIARYDLDEGWERFRQFDQARKNLDEAKKNAEDTNLLKQQIEDLRPEPEFWLAAFLGETRMQATKTYNTIVSQWQPTRAAFRQTLRTVLEMAAQPFADPEALQSAWQIPKEAGVAKEATACQVFNPTQGKGQNRPRPDGAKMENIKSFWPLEFLKAVGAWSCLMPRQVKGQDDRKAYVLAPLVISLGAHEAVFRTFAERLWNDTAVKMDIRAALLYTQGLLDYSQAGQQDELAFEDWRPEKIVLGFSVATFKLLSQNAYTMLSLGFLGLPRWTGAVETRLDVIELKEVIEEHLAVIQTIDEGRSDGYRLLTLYRDFLSGGLLETFFEFTGSFSQYLTQALEKGSYIRKFSTPNLRRLIMGMEPQYSKIIESEGFRNLAYAIRHSTILPQYRKRSGENLYEVRYGLGMELKRKAAYPREFLAALASFAQEYNQENVQKAESRGGQQMRRNIRTGDLEEIVRLVDQFGSEVVCNLLVAYGYASEPREETETQEGGQS